MTFRRRLQVAAALGGVAALVATCSTLAGAATTKLEVVAKDLNNPRKLFVAGEGALYVVEAGSGGDHKCFGTGPDAICVGRTGSVTKIAGGEQHRVLTGLVSWATAAAQRAQGAAAVVVEGETLYVLFGDAVTNKKGGNAFGRDGAMAGKLIALHSGTRSSRAVSDLAAFEATHNPDHGAGPGAKLGNPSIDSNPYALARYRGGFAVADAAANDLLWVKPTGAISLLAVFPTQPVKLTEATAKRLGAAAGTASLDVQSVPSSVSVGPDGALYVGELTGRPFQPGTARVWRVVPGRKPTVYADGFTNIIDLAFAGENLLVLEAAARGLWHTPWTGALIRVAPDKSRQVIASDGLVAPTGLAVGRRSIFIANYGFFPGSGPGPHGEVVSIPRSAAS